MRRGNLLSAPSLFEQSDPVDTCRLEKEDSNRCRFPGAPCPPWRDMISAYCYMEMDDAMEGKWAGGVGAGGVGEAAGAGAPGGAGGAGGAALQLARVRDPGDPGEHAHLGVTSFRSRRRC
jgi:hypothetical protein